MAGLLSVVGFLALVLALVGVLKGSLRSLGLSSRKQCLKTAALGLVVMTVGGGLAPDPRPATDAAARTGPAPTAAAPVTATPRAATPVATTARRAAVQATAAARASTPKPAPPRRTTAPVAPLLAMAAGGDGDSWRDTDGVEYRMGLINTPETRECGGAAATAYRRQALAGGFRAKAYATDDYGRKVSVIFAANGVNLNVAMARDGIANDKYLDRFRHENPQLAAQLDAAFREARAARRGIWSTCAAPAEGAASTGGGQPAPAPKADGAGGCHPDYKTCIPVVGDGSGRGAANDLDCGEIGETVYLREVGRDPYRLDGSDQDGVGCE